MLLWSLSALQTHTHSHTLKSSLHTVGKTGVTDWMLPAERFSAALLRHTHAHTSTRALCLSMLAPSAELQGCILLSHYLNVFLIYYIISENIFTKEAGEVLTLFLRFCSKLKTFSTNDFNLLGTFKRYCYLLHFHYCRYAGCSLCQLPQL